MILVQCSSNFNLHKNHLKSLLKQISISNMILGDTKAAGLKTYSLRTTVLGFGTKGLHMDSLSLTCACTHTPNDQRGILKDLSSYFKSIRLNIY